MRAQHAVLAFVRMQDERDEVGDQPVFADRHQRRERVLADDRVKLRAIFDLEVTGLVHPHASPWIALRPIGRRPAVHDVVWPSDGSDGQAFGRCDRPNAIPT
ncbi:hypothetical protein BTHI11S_03356 [Bosea thiooxidans]